MEIAECNHQTQHMPMSQWIEYTMNECKWRIYVYAFKRGNKKKRILSDKWTREILNTKRKSLQFYFLHRKRQYDRLAQMLPFYPHKLDTIDYWILDGQSNGKHYAHYENIKQNL